MIAARKILIYGVTGSGKTTLAASLSDRLGIPWHSVDDLTHEANWVQVSVPEQRLKILAICDRPDWILDAAYGSWLDIPLEHADLIIGLDYPRWLSLGRLLKRTLWRIVDQKPICNGNRESLKQALSRDSVLLWHFKSFKRKHDRMVSWSESENHPTVLRFTQPCQVRNWLTNL